jgi:beta-N-acetylhexosaminidase
MFYRKPSQSDLSRIDSIMGSLTLEQKVGQLFVFSLFGHRIYPDTYDRIIKMNCSGLRVYQGDRMMRRYTKHETSEAIGDYRIPEPGGRDVTRIPAPHLPAADYTKMYNDVKRMSMDRPGGIPLHLVCDQEGDAWADIIHGGVHFFPMPMGIGQSGDTDLCFRTYSAVAKQMRAFGINMLHSPVLDVNSCPSNPEINIRSFFDSDPDKTSVFASEMIRAFAAENLMATGKHFPGRGRSFGDAHYDVTCIDASREDLLKQDIAPFKDMINSGLRAIMLAHTAYASLDSTGDIATISNAIVNELLRQELGFDGVVTTDSISMGGLIKTCGNIPEACIRSIEAGADLVLLKDDDWITVAAYEAMVDAVKSGRISEKRIDESVLRSLKMKAELNLFDNYDIVDESKTESILNDPKLFALEKEVAEKSVTILRNQDNIIPLPQNARFLLVEQVSPLGKIVNNRDCHCSMIAESLQEAGLGNQGYQEVNFSITGSDIARTRERLSQADIIIFTNDYNRKAHNEYDPRLKLIKEVVDMGKKVIVISNCPYEKLTIPSFVKNVICTYGTVPATCRQVADMLLNPRM